MLFLTKEQKTSQDEDPNAEMKAMISDIHEQLNEIKEIINPDDKSNKIVEINRNKNRKMISPRFNQSITLTRAKTRIV